MDKIRRFDRPVGFWLLLLPGWWVLPLTNLDLINCIKLMFVFLIGSIVMRAAGCTINDMWDKDIDKKFLEQKQDRLPVVKFQFTCNLFFNYNVINWFNLSISIKYLHLVCSFSAIPLVILYPLAKRFTKWPQIFLGLTLVGLSQQLGLLQMKSGI